MRQNTMAALLRGALVVGLASCPLFAADSAPPDSGAGTFWALVLGMMFTIFGGFAFCYGLVKLTERVVQGIHARRLAPVSVPPMRHAA